MHRIAVLLVLAACGRIGFAPDPGAMFDGRPDAPTTCAPPYTQMVTGCYRLGRTLTTWLAAEQDCEADTIDAHLVVVDSVAEHDAVHQIAAGVADVWVAYNDRVAEGNLRWPAPGGIDPKPNFCFLGAAVNIDALDCVTQDSQSACPDWRYRSCTELHAYVCERDGSAPDPTAY